MTETELILTAARRYLIENHSYWAAKYSKERTGEDFPYTYTDNDYNLFPRYNILSAILDKVESLLNQDQMNFETCKRELIDLGITADNIFTSDNQNNIETIAIQDERNKFITFIQNISIKEIRNILPLPYRRRLTEEESKQVRQSLLEHWNFQGDYWEPLESLSPKPTTFLMASNLTDKDYTLIIEEIQKHVKGKLFEISEDQSDAEIDFSLFHPNCYEIIYCDKTFDWIVYGSHESTVAFGGTWLLNFIHQLYFARQEKLNKWDEVRST